MVMDKKDKKRLEVLRQKIDKTQKLIHAAQSQPDDPLELIELKRQLAVLLSDVEDLKQK
jgi:hypothetical protein